MVKIGAALFGHKRQNEKNLVDDLELVESLHFSCAELRPDSLPYDVSFPLSFKERQNLIDILESFSLKYIIHAPQNYVVKKKNIEFELNLIDTDHTQRKKTMESMINAYSFAEHISAEFFNCHLGRLPPIKDVHISPSEREKLLFSAINCVQKHLMNAGTLPVHIENSPLDLRQPYLGDCFNDFEFISSPISFDTGHYWLSVKGDPLEFKQFWKHFRRQIKHVHIHSNFAIPTPLEEESNDNEESQLGDLHLPLSKGTLNNSIIRDLLEDYTDFAVIELKEFSKKDLLSTKKALLPGLTS